MSEFSGLWTHQEKEEEEKTQHAQKVSDCHQYLSLQCGEVGHFIEEGEEDFVIPVHDNFDSPSYCCSS